MLRSRSTGRLQRQFQWGTRRLAILLLVLGSGMLIVHTSAGKHLVNAVYDGHLTPLLGHVLQGRDIHTADHYYDVLNRRLPHLVTAIFALSLVLLCLSHLRSRLAAVVLALDFLLIAIHCSFRARGRWAGSFSINMDGGYPEMFQYVKEAGIALAFAALYLKRRSLVSLVWSGVFLFVLLDDALQIHEGLAERFAQAVSVGGQFPGILGLKARDVGEIVVAGGVGSLIVACLALTYLGAAAADKRITRSMLALLGLLAVFGVGLDAAAMALASWWIGFLSDAGEMLAISAVVWYVSGRLGESSSHGDTLLPRLVTPAGDEEPEPRRHHAGSAARLV